MTLAKQAILCNYNSSKLLQQRKINLEEAGEEDTRLEIIPTSVQFGRNDDTAITRTALKTASGSLLINGSY
jgi:hypothetical protein